MSILATLGEETTVCRNGYIYYPQRCFLCLSGDFRMWQNAYMTGGEAGYADGRVVLANAIQFMLHGLSSPSVASVDPTGSAYYYSGASMTVFRQAWTDAGASLVNGLVWPHASTDYYAATMAAYDVILVCSKFSFVDGGVTHYLADELWGYIQLGGRVWMDFETYWTLAKVNELLAHLGGLHVATTAYGSSRMSPLALVSTYDEGIIAGNGGRKLARFSSSKVDAWDDANSAIYNGARYDGAGHELLNFMATWNPNGVGK